MAFIAECPTCGNNGPVPSWYMGRLVRCPKCTAAFRIRVSRGPYPPVPKPPAPKPRPLPRQPVGRKMEEPPIPAPRPQPRPLPRQPVVRQVEEPPLLDAEVAEYAGASVYGMEGPPSPPPAAEFADRDDGAEELPAVRKPRRSRDEDEVEDEPPRRTLRRGKDHYRVGRGKGLVDVYHAYSINPLDWLRPAWAHYLAVVGPMLGYQAILLVLFVGGVMTMSQLIAAGGYALLPLVWLIGLSLGPPLMAGFYVVCLAQLQGKKWSFLDFFAGFQCYGSLVGCAVLLAIFTVIVSLPLILYYAAATVVFDALKEYLEARTIRIMAAVLALILQFGSMYFQLRASYFCIPLIIDRGCGAMEAIHGSWILSEGHFWGLFGMNLLLGLIAFLGGALVTVLSVVLGVIGLSATPSPGVVLMMILVPISVPFFIFPFLMLSLSAGFLHIAGRRPPVEA